jgi:hypothetical protein
MTTGWRVVSTVPFRRFPFSPIYRSRVDGIEVFAVPCAIGAGRDFGLAVDSCQGEKAGIAKSAVFCGGLRTGLGSYGACVRCAGGAEHMTIRLAIAAIIILATLPDAP